MIEALKVPNRQAQPSHADFEHLIEVAIVKHSVPSNAHERPAHQAGNDRRIEVLDQQFHVVRAFFIAVQEVGEALDWHVRKSEQSMKLDGEVLAEVALVLSLQAALIGRQTCAQRVVYKIQLQLRAWHAISEPIEVLQSANALVKYTPAALGIYILGRIARQASGNLY